MFSDGILTNSQDSNVKMTCVPQEQFRTKYKEIVQKFEMDQLEKKSSETLTMLSSVIFYHSCTQARTDRQYIYIHKTLEQIFISIYVFWVC